MKKEQKSLKDKVKDELSELVQLDGDKPQQQASGMPTPAILMTGATHSRELISV